MDTSHIMQQTECRTQLMVPTISPHPQQIDQTFAPFPSTFTTRMDTTLGITMALMSGGPLPPTGAGQLTPTTGTCHPPLMQ